MNNFPQINGQDRQFDLFELRVPYNGSFSKSRPSPRFEQNPNPNLKPNLNINVIESDWTPDFSEHIDIESCSIGLALGTLNMSRGEYNSMSVQELKASRRIDCNGGLINALNILIYYKQNSKSFLPQLSPIKNKINWTESSTNGREKLFGINNNLPNEYKK